jgi:D-glycero-alpha-D-manno-heptose-7-phosphate kinase
VGALSVINSVAPIRICDNGGWTDTWFAGHGRIFNIAVSPYVEVQISVFPRAGRDAPVDIDVESFGDRYAITPGEPRVNRHPLLEAAIDRMPIPDEVSLGISIHSQVPAGCATGTSAAVAVALLGALDALSPGRMTRHEIASTAHELEVGALGRQCGIQDQLCSAYGGINYIEMLKYPHATISRVDVSEGLWWELEGRLTLVFLGSSHDSSAIHEQVIADLERGAAGLEALRGTAVLSRDAIEAGDLGALGRAMVANTEAQVELHPSLINEDAKSVIELARAHGALGWKVNGAGGPGGSLTVLNGASASEKRALHRAITELNPQYRLIGTRLSREGLRVWQAPSRTTGPDQGEGTDRRS